MAASQPHLPHRSRHRRSLPAGTLAALLVLLALLCPTGAMGAKNTVYRFTAQSYQGGVATFKVRHLANHRIKAARVRAGHQRRRLSVARVRSAARRGHLRVRLVRNRAPRVSAARRKPRKKPALTVVTSAPAASAGSGTGGGMVGLQLHPFNASDAEVTHMLDLAKQSGAKLVRADVGWSSIEQVRKGEYGAWYLSRIDSFLGKAQDRGIKVLLTVMNTPCWASTAPDSDKQGCQGNWWDRDVQWWAPRDYRDYGDIMAYLAHRYRGRVAAWELWNEPNHPFFWRVPSGTDQASAYVQLVKAAYPRIKAADPNTPVLAGVTASADCPFLEQLYQHGIKGYFDAYSIHPYNEWRDPNDPWLDKYVRYTFKRGTEAVHDVMVQHGDGGKKLWLTELGWSSCTDRGNSPGHECVTPQQQADYIKKAYAIARGWDFVATTVYYHLRDDGTDATSRLDNFGLVTHDWQPKPSFAAFGSVAAQASS